MKEQKIEVFTLDCGLRLAVEPIAGATTATIAWTVPVGYAGDPIGDAGSGEASVLAEVVLRGAGSRSSKEFSDALDRLGAQRGSSCSQYRMSVSATCMATETDSVLALLADIFLRPRIEQDALDASRELVLQSLQSLSDDPQHLVGIKCNEIASPAPFNQHGLGTEAGLMSLSTESLRATWNRRCRPGGSIIGIAGAVDPRMVRDHLDRLLDGWSGTSQEPTVTAPAVRGRAYESQPSSQSHMCLAFDSPHETSTDRVAHGILTRILGGGGMSNRLFTEVREKRGLCYSVGMSYATGRDRGLSSIYAGSTPEKASETLACIRRVVAGVSDGISDGISGGVTGEEFSRAVIGAKSALVINGESTAAHASRLASDLFTRGSVRTLAEVIAPIDRLTLQSVNDYASKAFTPQSLSLASLAVVGPAALS
ncbi:MAG: insulinase family protein [Phycisphaerales bacterium]|nr:insulinase family protein [Phycisphaerales bacterium]